MSRKIAVAPFKDGSISLGFKTWIVRNHEVQGLDVNSRDFQILAELWALQATEAKPEKEHSRKFKARENSD